jgi:hypothetical protein
VQQTPFPTRREFTVATALAMLSGVTITILGCGGSVSPAPPTSPSSVPDGVNAEISANHGHSAVVTRAQMVAGNELSLDIRGAADHPHTIVIAQNALSAIANGQRVTVESTATQAHAHLVAFN